MVWLARRSRGDKSLSGDMGGPQRRPRGAPKPLGGASGPGQAPLRLQGSPLTP